MLLRGSRKKSAPKPQQNHNLHSTLAGIFKNMFAAINAGNWDADSPFWSKNFAPAYSYHGLHGDYGIYEPVGLREHLDLLSREAESYPDYYMEFTDIWTDVSKFQDVRTYFNYDRFGCPPGIVKKGAAVVEWTQQDGRWLILEVKTMAGFMGHCPGSTDD